MRHIEGLIGWLENNGLMEKKVPLEQITVSSVAAAIIEDIRYQVASDTTQPYVFQRTSIERSFGYTSFTSQSLRKNQKGISRVGMALNQLGREGIIELEEIMPPGLFGISPAFYHVIDLDLLKKRAEE